MPPALHLRLEIVLDEPDYKSVLHRKHGPRSAGHRICVACEPDCRTIAL